MKSFWDLNAKTWSQVIDQKLITSRLVTNQAIVDAILFYQPKTVLDIGCGEGWLCAELSKRSVECAGIDGSEDLTRIAQNKYPEISFKKVSYQEIENGWQPQKQFDVVVFNFALMDEHLEKLLLQIQKFITANGRLLIQTLHFSALPEGKEGWQSEDFKSMRLPFQGTMPWYGRNLESWKQLFAESGWSLDRFVEPSQNGKSLSVLFHLKKSPERRAPF